MPTRSDDPTQVAAFIERVRGGYIVEADDWMPAAYRRSLTRFIEMHAHSEYMGGLLEREWLAKAPTLERKLALASKVQDEVGHGQLLYRILADLGRPMDEALADLIAGRSSFHWFFHHKAESWADTGIIAWLSDTAAAISQGDLKRCSYGPYARALTRICAEEQFHIQYGYAVISTLARGTAAQREMVQDALHRWWPRLLAFNGPPTPRDQDPNITDWCIKHMTNEDMRQKFLQTVVPALRALELEIDDPLLAFDESTQTWKYTEPDWAALQQYRRGGGPETRYWLAFRAEALRDSEWVRAMLRGADGKRERYVLA